MEKIDEFFKSLENGDKLTQYLLLPDVVDIEHPKHLCTPFIKICMGDDINLLKASLLVTKSINAKYDYGRSAIFYAFLNKKYEYLSLLVKAGANPYAKDIRGRNLMHHAKETHQINILSGYPKLLFEKDIFGCTPLHSAALVGDYIILNRLIELGSEINAVNNLGHTILHSVLHLHNYSLAEFLIKKGADVNIYDKDGISSLDLAKKYMHPDLLDTILNRR